MARYKSKKAKLKRHYGNDVETANNTNGRKLKWEHKANNNFVGGRPTDDSFLINSSGDAQSNAHEYEELQTYALTTAKDFSAEMRKYWRNRYMLFTLFDGSSPSRQLPLLDHESWYSVTPESIAARIAQRCRCSVILDAFCGVGGNAIQFALTCERVIAIEIDPIKLRMAKHNARLYGVEEFITFLQGDWRDFVHDWKVARSSPGETENKWKGCEVLNIDAVFLSPPWGGLDYRSVSNRVTHGHYSLSLLEPSGGEEMFKLASSITRNICMYLPRTVNLSDLSKLATAEDQADTKDVHVDVEEQWLAGHCRALSCYYGDLIDYVETSDRLSEQV